MLDTTLRNGSGVVARIALFIAIVATLRFTQYGLFSRHRPDVWFTQPSGLLIEELIRVVIVMVATWALARIEHRSIASCGLAPRRRWALLIGGSTWGIATLSIVIALQYLGGNVTFTISQDGWPDLVVNGFLWTAAFMAVAWFEELLLRGYLQSALGASIGFWPAALIWSAVFVWMHVSNDNESVLGLLQTGWIALFFCLSLRLTGSLWWAIGFHAFWDWSESFLFGVSNSGLLFEGRLMTAAAHGNVLLSGGAGGPEASLWSLIVLVIPAAALLRGRRVAASSSTSDDGYNSSTS